jgi:Multicopper oxidase
MNRFVRIVTAIAALVFVKRGPNRIDATYKKVHYVEYANATFTKRKPRPPESRNLGIVGPIIHAEVGDKIRIVFRNMASRLYSIHPHGVFCTKANEGAPSNDGTSGADRADDAAAPRKQHLSVGCSAARGTRPNDAMSVVWPYHSHIDPVRDANSGLIGAIIITRKGATKSGRLAKVVDCIFVTLFKIFNENRSRYLDDDIAALPGKPAKFDRDNADFIESSLVHSINGYVYGNMPMPKMKVGKHVSWYLYSPGTETDLHTLIGTATRHWSAATAETWSACCPRPLSSPT